MRWAPGVCAAASPRRGAISKPDTHAHSQASAMEPGCHPHPGMGKSRNRSTYWLAAEIGAASGLARPPQALPSPPALSAATCQWTNPATSASIWAALRVPASLRPCQMLSEASRQRLMGQVVLPGAPPNFRGAAGNQVQDCLPPGPYLDSHHTLFFCKFFLLLPSVYGIGVLNASWHTGKIFLSSCPRHAALVPGARPGYKQR